MLDARREEETTLEQGETEERTRQRESRTLEIGSG